MIVTNVATPLILIFAFVVLAHGQTPAPTVPLPPVPEKSTIAYPTGWGVQVQERTRLETIKQLYERRPVRLLATDLDDQSPLPKWFRGYLRDNLPGIPISGKYQYPRVASQILEWMLAHPDLQVAPSTHSALMHRQRARTIRVGSNINLTSLDEKNSESFIAQDYNRPQFLVAAANNLAKSGRQRQFFSSDGGATWGKTELPLPPGIALQSDPALAFSSDGTAWAATLGIDNLGTSIQVQVFKSTDHGATWSFVGTPSTGRNNDKELLWIDAFASSPFKDNIYLAWDVPGRGMRFSRSTDNGATWSPETILSNDRAIGSHLSTGPNGELYVSWPDPESREIRIRKSIDGGATFGETNVITITNSSYEISIPAMCHRKALVYVSIGIDRSNGPRRGTVYATWTDLNSPSDDPGCDGTTAAVHSKIHFSASTDGGDTWSPPRIIQAGSTPVSSDQFNQWMDIDQDNGKIHVIFYDTRDDLTRRKTNLYYVSSIDGGVNWRDETKVSSVQTDETVSGADLGNQYGDYNGLVAYRDVAFPSWTDRRVNILTTKEQIFTANISHSNDADTGNIDQEGNNVRTLSPQEHARIANQQDEIKAMVPLGTRLDNLVKKLKQETAILPARDFEDKTPLPIWFRVYLRKKFPNLPTSGKYQYPRTARRILQQLLDNPNSVP